MTGCTGGSRGGRAYTAWRPLARIIPQRKFVIPKRSEESPGEAGPVVRTDALRAGILNETMRSIERSGHLAPLRMTACV
jgi:hypothetical protein